MNDNETNASNAIVQVPTAAALAPGETAASAQAAQAQAQALARYAMAERHPRNMLDVRTRLLAECERPRFAEKAKYRIPYKQWNRELRREEVVHVVGPSIRFAEAAMRIMGNIDVATTTTYDDDEKRIVQVSATDLETNATAAKDLTIAKTIERRKLKRGQVPISIRKNAYGDDIFVLPATDQEFTAKVEAATSKAVRTCLLRLVPADILEECDDAIDRAVQQQDRADPRAALKRIVDAFSKLGVSASDLEKLLGHSLAGVIPAELDKLRGYHVAMADGQASWPQIIELEHSEHQAGTKDDPMAQTRKAVQDAIAVSKKKAEQRANGRSKASKKGKASKAPKTPNSAPGNGKEQDKPSAPEAAAAPDSAPASGDLLDEKGNVLLTAEEVSIADLTGELDNDGQKVPLVGGDDE